MPRKGEGIAPYGTIQLQRLGCQDGVIPSLSAAWAAALRGTGQFAATLNSCGKRRNHPIFSSVLIVSISSSFFPAEWHCAGNGVVPSPFRGC
jgi:hypothetical protein